MSSREQTRYSFDRFSEELNEAHLAFRQWLEKNPTQCAGGPRSPDGKSALRVHLKGGDGGDARIEGRWDRQAYSFKVKQGAGGSDIAIAWAVLRIVLEQQGRGFLISRWTARGDWNLGGSLIPCWSPDGTRVALLSFKEGSGSRDTGYVGVDFIPLGDLAARFPPLRP